jgi:hypothetical protein
MGSLRIGVVAILVAGADHQKPKTNDVSQAVRDLIERARIDHAGGEPKAAVRLRATPECRDPKTAGRHQIRPQLVCRSRMTSRAAEAQDRSWRVRRVSTSPAETSWRSQAIS